MDGLDTLHRFGGRLSGTDEWIGVGSSADLRQFGFGKVKDGLRIGSRCVGTYENLAGHVD
jgi:hypothetical protein